MKFIAIILVALVMVAIAIVAVKKAGRNLTTVADPKPSRDLGSLTSHLFRDAISVRKCSTATHSYFGGSPPASPKLTWPIRDGRALSFLACIDCGELPHSTELDWLPHTGFLLFFYDLKEQVWGFDPKDRGGAATIYLSSSDVTDFSAPALPPMPLAGEALIKKCHVSFRLTKLPPSWETAELKGVGLTEHEMDSFMAQRTEIYAGLPHHQIGGFADPVQNPEMDEECQLVTNGLYCGDATGYKDPRATKLKERSSDWSLLFQMDTDDDLDIMWGDAGMIYFWVRREDARNLNFTNIWLILQCG